MGVISLFSGCGGCSLGLKQAGIDVDLAVDMDQDTCNTYVSNLKQGIVWCTDLSKTQATDLLEKSNLRKDDITLIVGGPPCQGFSSAGAKDWADPRNVLIRNFVDIVTTLKPTWFIMENVEGLLIINIFDAINDLPSASETGVIIYNKAPQNDYQSRMRRLDGQPILHHQLKELNEAAQRRIALLRQGSTMKHLPEELQHASFSRRSYRRVMDGTPTENRGGAPSGLKRLIAYDPSLTITSGSPSEFIHPTENRPLTLRECARLQSFPDWYEFKVHAHFR